FNVLLYPSLVDSRIESLREPVHVQTQLAGVTVQIVPLQLPRVVEQLVVHFPKPPLRFRGQRGLGGECRIGVKRQRIMSKVKTQLAQVVFKELIERRRAAGAERTLKIREFDNRNWGLVRSLRRADKRNVLPPRIVVNRYAGLCNLRLKLLQSFICGLNSLVLNPQKNRQDRDCQC